MHVRVMGLAGLGLCVGLLAGAFPVQARSCRTAALAPASPEMREFRNSDLGLALAIPSNYRSMLRSSGHITFHDPSSFEFIQCLVRTGEYGEVPPYVTLEIYPGVAVSADLIQIVRVKRPWVDYYSPAFEPIKFADRPAIQYEYVNEIYRLTIQNISFLSSDGTTLITLSGPAEHPIMQNALSTLAVESSTP